MGVSQVDVGKKKGVEIDFQVNPGRFRSRIPECVPRRGREAKFGVREDDLLKKLGIFDHEFRKTSNYLSEEQIHSPHEKNEQY